MVKIGAITTARSDFGIMRPLYSELVDEVGIDFSLIVSGSYFLPEFSNSLDEIEKSGIPIKHRVEINKCGSEPKNLARFSGKLCELFGEFFDQHSFDLVLFLGDRFEYLPILQAGSFFNQPFGHFHGGERTLGAIDDVLRDCLTRLSHLHFVANKEFASRVAMLGEDKWRILVTGSPGIDEIVAFKPLPRDKFLERFDLQEKAFVLVTLHPETIDLEQAKSKVDLFFTAIEKVEESADFTWLFTLPGQDTGSQYIREKIESFRQSGRSVIVESNLGRTGYLNAMAHGELMIGNSSSGVVEAPYLGIPVINVGDRQAGRPLAENVCSVEYDVEKLVKAFETCSGKRKIATEKFYGSGNAVTQIVDVLKKLPDRRKLIRKGWG